VATLDKVAVEITVVLGTTSMPIHQVLRLAAARSSSWTPPKKTQSASLPTTRRWPIAPRSMSRNCCRAPRHALTGPPQGLHGN